MFAGWSCKVRRDHSLQTRLRVGCQAIVRSRRGVGFCKDLDRAKIFVSEALGLGERIRTQHGIRGKVVIVTGSSHGIGAAAVKRFLAEGATAAAASRNAANLERLGRELDAGGRLTTHVTDVSSLESVGSWSRPRSSVTDAWM